MTFLKTCPRCVFIALWVLACLLAKYLISLFFLVVKFFSCCCYCCCFSIIKTMSVFKPTLLLCRSYEAIAYIRDNAVCRIPYEICRTAVRILPIIYNSYGKGYLKNH